MKTAIYRMILWFVVPGLLLVILGGLALAIDPEAPLGPQPSTLGSTVVPRENVGERAAPMTGVGVDTLSFAHACPQCVEVSRQLQEVNATFQQLRQNLAKNRNDKSSANAKIAELEARLAAAVGTTFMVTDPDGNSTTGEILDDESVRYTMRDPQGRSVGTRTEARRGLRAVRDELDAERARWERLKEEEIELQQRTDEAAARTEALRAGLVNCIRERCSKFLVIQALLLQAFGISGVNFYAAQNPVGSPTSAAPPAPTPPAAPPPAVPNLFVSGVYGCGGCGLLGSTTVTAIGSIVTIVPGPNGVTLFTVVPPGSTAIGGGCTVMFSRPVPVVCALSISCAAPACSASCSFSPCP